MHAKYFALIVAIGIFLFVINLIRREKMTFRYSLFWLSACIAVVTLALWDGLLRRISSLAGFELPSNFVFFLLLAFFTALSLMLTIYINEQNNRTQALAQAISQLQFKINQLEKNRSDGRGK
jgi:hypothetical protein